MLRYFNSSHFQLIQFHLECSRCTWYWYLEVWCQSFQIWKIKIRSWTNSRRLRTSCIQRERRRHRNWSNFCVSIWWMCNYSDVCWWHPHCSNNSEKYSRGDDAGRWKVLETPNSVSWSTYRKLWVRIISNFFSSVLSFSDGFVHSCLQWPIVQKFALWCATTRKKEWTSPKFIVLSMLITAPFDFSNKYFSFNCFTELFLLKLQNQIISQIHSKTWYFQNSSSSDSIHSIRFAFLLRWRPNFLPSEDSELKLSEFFKFWLITNKLLNRILLICLKLDESVFYGFQRFSMEKEKHRSNFCILPMFFDWESANNCLGDRASELPSRKI